MPGAMRTPADANTVRAADLRDRVLRRGEGGWHRKVEEMQTSGWYLLITDDQVR
jgi:hypothetical protein